MVKYPIHTEQSAPTAARTTLNNVVKAWGFLPNLGAVIAESPAALELLWAGYGALTSKATLSPAEQQLVCVAASRENRCSYCVAAHSTMALGADLPPPVLNAVRDSIPIADKRLEALRKVTQTIVQQRGWLSEADKQQFVDAGFSPGQLLEVVGWVSMKILTNYTNHIAETPVDPQWSGQAWTPPRD
jgi:uncharacterized peroxidase-related enzyme